MQNDNSKIVIGDGTWIQGELLVFAYGGNIKLCKNCYIGDGTRIWSGESIVIEDDVFVSHNVNIMDTNTHELEADKRLQSYEQIKTLGFQKEKGEVLTKPVYIDRGAWIGFNSIILKGINIGKHSIIAAGSVVTKDVPDYCMVGGNPARILKYLR